MPAKALFLSGKSVCMFACVCACVCVCVCVRPQAIKNYSHETKSIITNQTSPTAFQFLCKALAIDTIDGRGLSNEAHRELLPKKSKVMLYFPFFHRKSRLVVHY